MATLREMINSQNIICNNKRGRHDHSQMGPANENIRIDFRFVPTQWETALLCNDVSQWLGANLESALNLNLYCNWNILDNEASVMPSDALAPRVARPPVTLILNAQDKRTFVFHEESFDLPGLSYAEKW